MTVVSWWQFVLLGLAVFRLFRLLSADDILDRPRKYILGLSGWTSGRPTPPGYRENLADFIRCPWCLGFWLALGWWGLWQLWPHTILVASVPLALSALVGIVSTVLPDE